MKRSFVIVSLLLLVVALAACGGGTPAATQAPAAAATQPPAAAGVGQVTAAPAATAAPSPVPTVAPTPRPAATAAPAATIIAAATRPATAVAPAATIATGGQTDLPALKPGALKSYVTAIEFSEEALKPTPATTSKVKMQTSYRAEPAPAAYSFQVVDETKTGSEGQMKMIVFGTDTFIYMADQQKWLKASTAAAGMDNVMGEMLDPNKIAADAPAGLFTQQNVISANETLEGVRTTHYRATGDLLTRLVAQDDPDILSTTGQADFWVANDTGYLKQYVLDATVTKKDGSVARQLAKMTVTKENQPIDIQAPPAADVLDMSGMMGGPTPTPSR